METEQSVQAMPQKEIARKQSAKDYIEKIQRQIINILPQEIDKKKYIQAAIFAVNKIPKILECTPISIMNCVMESSRLGLEIGGIRGECYIIPYNDRKNDRTVAQFMLGYQGMLSLLFKTGRVKNIQVKEVYEDDHFAFEYGNRGYLIHQPSLKEDRGAFKAVYAMIETTNGGFPFEVMSKSEIDKIRDMSQDYKYKKENSIWGKFYPAMAKKTVIRQLFKYLPLTAEIQRAVLLDEQADSGMQDIIISDNDSIVDVEEPKSNSDKLTSKLAG
jgi:recombination protein RecT